MKKMFSFIKVSTFLLAFGILFSNPTTVNAEETILAEKETYLISIGTPEEYVSEMSEHQINSLYERLKDHNNVEFGNAEKSFFYISDDGTNEGIVPYAISNLELDVYYYNYYNGQKISYVEVGAFYTWLEEPRVRMTDAMSLNWKIHIFHMILFISVV